MGPDDHKVYLFDDFCLSPAEYSLSKAGEPISLKPKAFSILLLLIENQGRLVERSEILDKIWGDSFVEEGAVSKSIWSIRAALGEDSKEPKFIQTVPKRGYRFVGAVQIVSNKLSDNGNVVIDESSNGTARHNIEMAKPLSLSSANRWYNRLFLPGFLLLMIGFAVVSVVAYFFSIRLTTAPILTQPFDTQHLSTDGHSTHPALSPDGATLYYVKEIGDQQTIRLRDIKTGNESELTAAAAAVKYYGMSISPDGRNLFFARRLNSESMPTLFRLSIPAGIPQKIAEKVQGWFSVSPDGSSVAFVRCEHQTNDYCSLYMADAETGENERKLVTKAAPFQIGANVFTRDGKFIIYATGQSHTAGNDFELKKIDIATREEFPFSPERYFYIRNITRLGDSNSMIFSAVRSGVQKAGLWKIDTDTAQIEEIGRDNQNFNAITFNKTATIGISSSISGDFHLQLFSDAGEGGIKDLSAAAHAAFLPDGRIVFTSDMSGQRDVWIIKQDGSDLKQITSDTADELSLVASPDGSKIYYSSSSSGDLQIWRVNADGTIPVRLTKHVGGHPLLVTADNKTLFFQSNIDNTLWSVDTDGSSSETMIRKLPSTVVALSPDGSMIAYPQKQANDLAIAISSLRGEHPARTFTPAVQDHIDAISWSADGSSVYYLQSRPGIATVFRQPANGSSPIKIRDIPINRDLAESCFAVSHDGRQMTVLSGEWKHDLLLISGLKRDQSNP